MAQGTGRHWPVDAWCNEDTDAGQHAHMTAHKNEMFCILFSSGSLNTTSMQFNIVKQCHARKHGKELLGAVAKAQQRNQTPHAPQADEADNIQATLAHDINSRG